MSYLVGIDIGGTFTDCAIVDRSGRLLTTKVPSTPQDFSQGMMDALQTGAQALDLTLDDFCRDIAFLSHGTTVGTNTIIQKKGARVGLITTRGHEDAIHIINDLSFCTIDCRGGLPGSKLARRPWTFPTGGWAPPSTTRRS
jgi:N-methylhydantoinase A